VSFGSELYGDPCRECGFRWSTPVPEAIKLVEGAPKRLKRTVAGTSGRDKRSELSWSVVAYIAHVGDNLRIWAERLAGIALGASPEVAAYDDNLLAVARSYGDLSVEGALWALSSDVDTWKHAVVLALDKKVVVYHPDRGDQTVPEVVLGNVHDVVHHEWDIARSLGVYDPAGEDGASWVIDEVAHAGPEHLRRDYVEHFDAKSATDFDETVAHLKSLGLCNNSVVIDMGAGTGAFAVAAAPHSRRVIAVDVSPAMAGLAQARAKSLNLDNVEVVRSGLVSYEHFGDPADFVHSRNTLHQLPDFWKVMALRRIHRILRPKGILHLRDLVFSFSVGDTESAIGGWLEGASKDPARGWTALEYATHLREEYSTFSWVLEEMLSRTGFEIIDFSFSGSGIYASYDCRRI